MQVKVRGKTITVAEDEQYKKYPNPAEVIPKMAGVFGGKKTVSAGSASGSNTSSS